MATYNYDPFPHPTSDFERDYANYRDLKKYEEYAKFKDYPSPLTSGQVSLKSVTIYGGMVTVHDGYDTVTVDADTYYSSIMSSDPAFRAQMHQLHKENLIKNRRRQRALRLINHLRKEGI